SSLYPIIVIFSSFLFQESPTPALYTLSLHDALPISPGGPLRRAPLRTASRARRCCGSRTSGRSGRARRPDRSSRRASWRRPGTRSEEHTSELQSRGHLVCRLLLEKKKNDKTSRILTE